MSIAQYGDYQFDIYFDGLEGQLPKYPVDFATLERKAAETLPSWVYSYVAGGCGDEGTQRANVDAFSRYAIVPRMLVGATERDLSVSLFDMTLPTPVFMAPIDVIGLCSQDFHGDIAVAKASAQTAVPMSAGTLTQDRMEDVMLHAGDTPALAGADPNSRIQLDVIAPEKLLSTPEDARAVLSKVAEAVRSVFGPDPLPAHGPWVHVYTIPHDQWAQDGRVPDWEGFRALLRADSPEKADEALALIYGPGRHTAAVWGSHSS